MIIEKETKLRLATMLVTRSLIVVGRRINRMSSTYDFKFIAVKDGGKWDMIPCVIYLSECSHKDWINARGCFWQVILERAIKQMNEEGISFFTDKEIDALLNGVAFFEM